MYINPQLIKLARHTLNKQRQKMAFQPPGGGGDPSQGGQPPMDPAMMGGGGAPPMDPSMMGGAPPPMDPAMMGGGGAPMPPPPPGGDPAAAGGAAPMPGGGGMTSDTIRQVMQEVLGQLGMVPGQAGPGGGAAGGKPGKPDLLAMSMDIFQIKKMMSTLFNAMGIEMPQDILDGPNRDPSTGAPMTPGMPGSTSDPSRVSPPAGGGQQAGPDSSIKPIGGIQGAFPSAGGAGGGGGGMGGGEKTGGVPSIGSEAPRRDSSARDVGNKAAALNAVLRRKLRK